MKCERCESDHDGAYGSGRFCTKQCARGFSTSKNRERINEAVSLSLLGRKTTREIRRKAKVIRAPRPRGPLPKPKTCPVCQIVYFGRTKKTCSVKCFVALRRTSKLERISAWWDSNSPTPFEVVGYHLRQLREFLIARYGACWECGWAKRNPVTGLIPLELEHEDGDCTNNVKPNLKLLCPNCHSLTPTYRSLNNGKSKRSGRVA